TKLDCCGSPLLGVDDELSLDLTQKKITDAKASGADYLCSACVYCQLQFDRVQKMLLSRRNEAQPLPSILYTQLLGLSLGIDEAELGISRNELDAKDIINFLA
ncbi:MAG: heterodisulfide reductase-related iron-sulfur binding cluster, partial [Desulfobacterales bacterium]|nr:heterodisulfide reductase-related iron-sulfur binding cluster [Desulfobacterales bacterium]